MGWRRAGFAVGAVFLGAVVFVPAASRADAEEAPSASATYDCGTLALYTLLKLEKRPADLAALESCLPAPPPRGYSMKQLRDAARTFGLALIGVRLSKREGALDRPALVFLKEGAHGHFLVIRPLGQTGKLVQVLDANRMPDVVDAADLYASPGWTGLALIPDRPHWPARIAVVLLIVASGLLLVRVVPRLRLRRGAKPKFSVGSAA